jgi:hypothetical protein
MTQKFGYSPRESKSDTITRSDWEDFLAQNEAKVKAWQAESSEDLWTKHLREGGILLSRAEVMQIIHKKWDESQSLITEELKKELAKLAEVHQQDQRGGIAASEAVAISKEVFHGMYKDLQLKAFSQSQSSEQVAYHNLQRPNFFSFGLGAVIIPAATSPTFDFSTQRGWLIWRIISMLVGYGVPPPKQPAVALTKWDEAGECWCSPTKGPGAGVSIGVALSYDLYPKEIVIEHIPKSATLDATSAPQEMELLARIEGTENMKTVSKMSQETLRQGPEQYLDRGWYTIGTFRYDIDSQNHVQHFDTQVDLQSVKISAREYAVRAKSNWGNPDYTCLYRIRLYGELADPAIA